MSSSAARKRTEAHIVAQAAAASLTKARSAFAADAVRAAKGRTPTQRVAPKGMRGSGLSFVRNAGGEETVDPVSLSPIPARRAVKIGKQYWNSRTLRDMLAVNPRATNPLTRQPLPAHVVKKYGPRLRSRWPGGKPARHLALTTSILGLVLDMRWILDRPASRQASGLVDMGYTPTGEPGMLRRSYALFNAYFDAAEPGVVIVTDSDGNEAGIFTRPGRTLVFTAQDLRGDLNHSFISRDEYDGLVVIQQTIKAMAPIERYTYVG